MASKELRARRRSEAPGKLKGRGFEIEVKNDGAHIIIRCAHGNVDFWPGPDRWFDRMTDQAGKGFDTLLRRIQKPPTVAGAVALGQDMHSMAFSINGENVEAACRARWPLHWDGFSECSRDNERGYMRVALAAYEISKEAVTGEPS